jgi:hypothetical protein
LSSLKIDFREYVDYLHEIYDLYTLDDQDVLEEKPHAPGETISTNLTLDELDVLEKKLLEKKPHVPAETISTDQAVALPQRLVTAKKRLRFWPFTKKE